MFAPVIRFTYTESPTSARRQVYGTGCVMAAQSFYEAFASGTNDMSGTTVTMTQNANSGYDVVTSAGATIAPGGSALGLGDDVISTPLNLPFTFDYPGGGATSQIRVDSNGNILLNGNAASLVGGGAGAMLGSSRHRPCPSLQDLDPSVGGGVFAGPDPANPTTVYLVRWQAVPCFQLAVPSGQTSTFEVALIDNGTNDSVEYRYAALVNDSTNGGVAVTGFSRGPGALDGGNRDLTAGPFSTATDHAPLVLGATRSVLNTTVTFTTSNIPPPGVSLLFISSGQLNPGVDLGSLGMPGCNGYLVLPEFLSFVSIGAPSVVTSVPIPNDPLLVGAQAFCQSGALDPAANVFGAIVSNGIKLTIGDS